MIASSIAAMEKCCPSNEDRDNTMVLLRLARKELLKYYPISSEMRQNKQCSVVLIDEIILKLREFM